MTMQIKIHRGTHQIGGCVTEISSGGTRILIDIGENLPGCESETEVKLTGHIDGIFVTHYHGDHVGLFDKIDPAIPVYMGTAAIEIMKVLQYVFVSLNMAQTIQKDG
jgi:ribonuclease J